MATISSEMKCYFERLIEPLVTNKSFEDPISTVKDGLLKKSLIKKSPSKMLKLKSSNSSNQFMKTQLIS